jgi:hypothetical protein
LQVPAEVQVGRSDGWLLNDRIRLIDLLRKSPAPAGFFYGQPQAGRPPPGTGARARGLGGYGQLELQSLMRLPAADAVRAMWQLLVRGGWGAQAECLQFARQRCGEALDAEAETSCHPPRAAGPLQRPSAREGLLPPSETELDAPALCTNG